MDDWASVKARDIVSFELGFTTNKAIFGRQQLRDKIAQALREAHDDGRKVSVPEETQRERDGCVRPCCDMPQETARECVNCGIGAPCIDSKCLSNARPVKYESKERK